MGYRGWPQGLMAGESNGFHWGRATHNAYRRLGVPVVGRWVACRPGGPWFCVDWAEGTGSHRLTNRLHLHPDLDVKQASDGEIRIGLGGTELRLRPLTPGSLELTSGWYCPQLGHRLRCPVVQWTPAVDLRMVSHLGRIRRDGHIVAVRSGEDRFAVDGERRDGRVVSDGRTGIRD